MNIDKDALIALAKKRGLDIAEDAVQNLAELALDVVGEIVKSTKNTYDDMIWAGVEGKAREQVRELVDKIDGEDDDQ